MWILVGPCRLPLNSPFHISETFFGMTCIEHLMTAVTPTTDPTWRVEGGRKRTLWRIGPHAVVCMVLLVIAALWWRKATSHPGSSLLATATHSSRSTPRVSMRNLHYQQLPLRISMARLPWNSIGDFVARGRTGTSVPLSQPRPPSASLPIMASSVFSISAMFAVIVVRKCTPSRVAMYGMVGVQQEVCEAYEALEGRKGSLSHWGNLAIEACVTQM